MWPRGHRTSLRTDVLMQINEDGDRCRTVSPPGADGSLGIPETPESLLPWVEGNLPWKMGNAIRRKYQDVHTEAVQAALAKHKEWKMAVPMPSKRRSLVVQTSMDAYTPPDTSSGSEDEGSLQGDSQGTPTSSQGSINMEHWISQAIHGSTTSTTSSSSTQSGDSRAANRVADVMAQTHMDNHSAPPDVTTYTSEHSIQMERPQGSTGSRTAPKYCNAELMETGNALFIIAQTWRQRRNQNVLH
ncbi:disco-interacting protein 2 homolog C-like isoform X1 [Macaca nemestrina]